MITSVFDQIPIWWTCWNYIYSYFKKGNWILRVRSKTFLFPFCFLLFSAKVEERLYLTILLPFFCYSVAFLLLFCCHSAAILLPFCCHFAAFLWTLFSSDRPNVRFGWTVQPNFYCAVWPKWQNFFLQNTEPFNCITFNANGILSYFCFAKRPTCIHHYFGL